MTYKKKLIEVALPLEDINKEAAREKSIRHGHPSTLHLWWARRPLAETARDLSYRLYTVCERRKWSQEAIGYNALVLSWPDLKRLADEQTATRPVQRELI